MVRIFKEQDAPQVRDLIDSILETEFIRTKKAYAPSDLDDIQNAYGGSRDVFYIAEEESKIIGTVAIKEDGSHTALLRRLFVHPNYRRRGFGSSLLDAALKFCKEKRYKEVIFRSTSDMKDATALCIKNGFRICDRVNFEDVQIVKLKMIL